MSYYVEYDDDTKETNDRFR